MLRSAKVAIPPTALRLTVPDRVPPAGFVPMAMVITFVAVPTVFPRLSWTATCGAGDDIECGAGRRRETRRGGGQRVTAPCLGDRQVRERGDSVHRALARGPGEGAGGRIGSNGKRDDRG